MDHVASLIQQDVCVVPVFDLKQVRHNAVACHTLHKVSLRDIVGPRTLLVLFIVVVCKRVVLGELVFD